MSKDQGSTFTAEVPKRIKEDEFFNKWENKIDQTQFVKVEAAKSKIMLCGLITSVKDLKGGLYEKKWKSGLRLYFSIIQEEDGKKTLLLLGSGKGVDQSKAIKKSRKSLLNYTVIKENIKL